MSFIKPKNVKKYDETAALTSSEISFVKEYTAKFSGKAHLKTDAIVKDCIKAVNSGITDKRIVEFLEEAGVVLEVSKSPISEIDDVSILVTLGGIMWKGKRVYFNRKEILAIFGVSIAYDEYVYYNIQDGKFYFPKSISTFGKKASNDFRAMIAAKKEESKAPTVKKDKSKIMRQAWEIAKKAAEKFGGPSKLYIAEALKMAHRGKALVFIEKSEKPKFYTCDGCGCTLSPRMAMSASFGTVCPDCYDDYS